MKAFNNIQEIQEEKKKLHDNKTLYTLLNVIIGELDRLPTRENPSSDQIYNVINKMYNNAKEMSEYNDNSKIEVEYLKDFIKQQLTEEELEDIISKCIENGVNNIGAIMKYLNTHYKGMFNGKTANEIIKKLNK